MLQLHRPLHCSATVQLGHLTTGPSSPSMPSKERFSHSAGNAFDCLPAEAVPVASPLCPPTSPHPMVGWLRFALKPFSPHYLWLACPTYVGCPGAI